MVLLITIDWYLFEQEHLTTRNGKHVIQLWSAPVYTRTNRKSGHPSYSWLHLFKKISYRGNFALWCEYNTYGYFVGKVLSRLMFLQWQVPWNSIMISIEALESNLERLTCPRRAELPLSTQPVSTIRLHIVRGKVSRPLRAKQCDFEQFSVPG